MQETAAQLSSEWGQLQLHSWVAGGATIKAQQYTSTAAPHSQDFWGPRAYRRSDGDGIS